MAEATDVPVQEAAVTVQEAAVMEAGDKTKPAKTKPMTFQGLSQAVVAAWTRFGFPWQEIVEGFGAGSGGLGMPPQDVFRDLARDAIDLELKGLPEGQMRRLMRSRLYRRHCDFEWHYGFTHGNRQGVYREELLWLAVWAYLCQEMERQYSYSDPVDADPVDPKDEEDGDEEDAAQLALPL